MQNQKEKSWDFHFNAGLKQNDGQFIVLLPINVIYRKRREVENVLTTTDVFEFLC